MTRLAILVVLTVIPVMSPGYARRVELGKQRSQSIEEHRIVAYADNKISLVGIRFTLIRNKWLTFGRFYKVHILFHEVYKSSAIIVAACKTTGCSIGGDGVLCARLRFYVFGTVNIYDEGEREERERESERDRFRFSAVSVGHFTIFP